MLTLLFATALLSSAPPPASPRAPGPQLAPYASAAPAGRSVGASAARPLPPDAPARAQHSVRARLWSAVGNARLVRSRPSGAGSALFSLKAQLAPTRSLVVDVDPLTHAAAARERLEDVRTQVLTSAGMGVAGLLTSGALRLLGAPLPRLPEVLGLRLAPLQTLPLSLSVQGSLP